MNTDLVLPGWLEKNSPHRKGANTVTLAQDGSSSLEESQMGPDSLFQSPRAEARHSFLRRLGLNAPLQLSKPLLTASHAPTRAKRKVSLLEDDTQHNYKSIECLEHKQRGRLTEHQREKRAEGKQVGVVTYTNLDGNSLSDTTWLHVSQLASQSSAADRIRTPTPPTLTPVGLLPSPASILKKRLAPDDSGSPRTSKTRRVSFNLESNQALEFELTESASLSPPATSAPKAPLKSPPATWSPSRMQCPPRMYESPARASGASGLY